jgi:hypothetical protein
LPTAGEVPVLAVDYGADGEVMVKTAIGTPLAAKNGHIAKCSHIKDSSGHLLGSSNAIQSLGSSLSLPSSRHLPLLLILSCVAAALAAVAGGGSGLCRVLGLPWLS